MELDESELIEEVFNDVSESSEDDSPYVTTKNHVHKEAIDEMDVKHILKLKPDKRSVE